MGIETGIDGVLTATSPAASAMIQPRGAFATASAMARTRNDTGATTASETSAWPPGVIGIVGTVMTAGTVLRNPPGTMWLTARGTRTGGTQRSVRRVRNAVAAGTAKGRLGTIPATETIVTIASVRRIRSRRGWKPTFRTPLALAS